MATSDPQLVVMNSKAFEEMEVWRTAKSMVIDVYRMTAKGALARDYGFKDQIQRAAVSAMSNIAEGVERKGNRERIHFLSIAKGSSAEVRSLVHVATDLGYISDDEKARLLMQVTSVSRQLAGFIKYLGRLTAAPVPDRLSTPPGAQPFQS